MRVQKLKTLRINKGFLQREVARAADVSAGFYCLVERGIRMPSLETSKKISVVLEISLDELYDSLNRGEKENELCEMD